MKKEVAEGIVDKHHSKYNIHILISVVFIFFINQLQGGSDRARAVRKEPCKVVLSGKGQDHICRRGKMRPNRSSKRS